jgi:hypothetical protein
MIRTLRARHGDRRVSDPLRGARADRMFSSFESK